MTLLTEIDALISRDGAAFAPRWGWHDDHREADGTPSYLPALQQVRGETAGLLGVLIKELNDGADARIHHSRCLQLGLGECRASHHVWQLVFDHVTTLDWANILVDDAAYPGIDIASGDAVTAATPGWTYYDFLLIDAGHTAEDARRDHARFGPLVRPGGIIAFHDALRRPGFEEAVQVWRYLETLDQEVHMIGAEVGVAWVRA